MKKSVLVVVNPSKQSMSEVKFGGKITRVLNFLSKTFSDIIITDPLDSEINIKREKPIFKKDKGYSNFSTFYFKKGDESLYDYLTKIGTTDVYFSGLSGDEHVKDTCLDCVKEGFSTYFIIDGTRFKNGKIKETVEELIKNGIKVINSNDVTFFLNKKD